MKQEPTSLHQMLAQAADHLRSALQLLDSASASPHIGAHVDLALHQLETDLLGIADRELPSSLTSPLKS